MNNSMKNGITYTGKVTVETRKGGKCLSRHTYHNAGGDPLFSFLSSCIVSNNYKANNAPRYIKLFTNTSSNPDVNTPAGTYAIDSYSEAVSSAIYYNAGEVVEDENGKPAAYLHFTVPFSAIHHTGSDSSLKIYQAALYSANHTSDDNKTDYSACFNFAESSVADGDVS